MSDKLTPALEAIIKKHGEHSIKTLSDYRYEDIQVIPTGLISLDKMLEVDGIPRGKITEIYGPESSGKSTLALEIVRNAQELGIVCAYIDMEHSLDNKAIGVKVNSDQLIISKPETGEQAADIITVLAGSNEVGLIIVDSVDALVPAAVLEGDAGDRHVGNQAQLMSQLCRILNPMISKTNTAIIFINQIRMKIGGYGNPEVTSGGKALAFYAAVRLDIRRIEPIKDGDKVIGARTKIKIVKNKCGPGYRQVECDLIYGQGFDRLLDLIDTATAFDIIHKSGAWYSYKDTKIGQGKQVVKTYLLNNMDLNSDILKQIKERSPK